MRDAATATPDWTALLGSEVSVAILESLSSRRMAFLAASCKQLRLTVHNYASTVKIRRSCDLSLVLSQGWPNLTALMLSHTQLEPSQITSLSEGYLPALQTLDLSHNCMQPAAVQHLTQGNWQSLTCLRLAATFGHAYVCEGDSYGFQGHCIPIAEVVTSCRYLACGIWPQLAALDISSNHLSTPAVAQLARADWPRLQALDMSSHVTCKAAFGMIKELAQAHWTAMQDLNLSTNMLSDDDACHLGSLPWAQLTKLDIAGCFDYAVLGSEARIACWQHIACGAWHQLASLNVSNNRLYGLSLTELSEKCWPALQSLDLSYNPDVAKEFYPEGLHWSRLARLSLKGCSSGVSGWPRYSDFNALLENLMSSAQLTALDISHNILNPGDLPCLGALTLLEELKLGGDALTFFTSCPRMQWCQLRFLDLRGGIVDPVGVVAVLEACGRTLDTLYITCSALQQVAITPTQRLWPVNTFLDLAVSADPGVLQSLCTGYWPAIRLKIKNTRRAALSQLSELRNLAKWDPIAMQELSLVGLDIGDLTLPHRLLSSIFHKSWPFVCILDLSRNRLTDEHVWVLIGSNLPSLEFIDLSVNELEDTGVSQLVHAHWPMLTCVDVRGNRFNRNGVAPDIEHFLLESFSSKWPSVAVCLSVSQDDRMLQQFHHAVSTTRSKIIELGCHWQSK